MARQHAIDGPADRAKTSGYFRRYPRSQRATANRLSRKITGGAKRLTNALRFATFNAIAFGAFFANRMLMPVLFFSLLGLASGCLARALLPGIGRLGLPASMAFGSSARFLAPFLLALRPVAAPWT